MRSPRRSRSDRRRNRWRSSPCAPAGARWCGSPPSRVSPTASRSRIRTRWTRWTPVTAPGSAAPDNLVFQNMKMQVAYVRIFVSDLERALEFYNGLLGLEISYRDDEFGWAQLRTDGAVLALERPPEAGDSDLVGRYLGVSVLVDEDLVELHERLSGQGVAFSGEPKEMPWGGAMTQIADPDGNVLTLMQ
ncbi:MAG: VOC family protein [Gammaproteobacteria bacterium]|nr:MAG: VOC family protein [Gammaproteobacteria bacterium]